MASRSISAPSYARKDDDREHRRSGREGWYSFSLSLSLSIARSLNAHFPLGTSKRSTPCSLAGKTTLRTLTALKTHPAFTM